MVGVSLSGFTLSEFLGGAPGDKTFADPHILTVSILTTAIVLVLSLLGKGLLKSFSFLIALVVGTVVAAALAWWTSLLWHPRDGWACRPSCLRSVHI